MLLMKEFFWHWWRSLQFWIPDFPRDHQRFIKERRVGGNEDKDVDGMEAGLGPRLSVEEEEEEEEKEEEEEEKF